MSESWDEPLETTDASGVSVSLAAPAKRVVSLVPSITETLFALDGGVSLVGRTRYCIHPAPEVRAIENIGGTKDLAIERILELAPDLVLANREENVAEQIQALRVGGLNVHVSEPRTPDDALVLVAYIGSAIDALEKAAGIVIAGESVLHTLAESRAEAQAADALRMKPHGVPKVLALIWRDPWMAAGGDTYISAMIETLGGVNAISERERYPELGVAEMRELAPEIVLLPSEPWPFNASDQAELTGLLAPTPAAKKGRILLCNGEDLMWFGARTPSALGRLRPLFT